MIYWRVKDLLLQYTQEGLGLRWRRNLGWVRKMKPHASAQEG